MGLNWPITVPSIIPSLSSIAEGGGERGARQAICSPERLLPLKILIQNKAKIIFIIKSCITIGWSPRNIPVRKPVLAGSDEI